MKAIILAEEDATGLGALTGHCPKPMLPFLNRPLLEIQLDWLGRNGFRKVGIVAPLEIQDEIRRRFESAAGQAMTLCFIQEREAQGSAGCLRLFESFLGSDPGVPVLAGDTVPEGLDITDFRRAHLSVGAALSVAVHRDDRRAGDLENVVFSGEGRVSRFELLHRSRDRRRPSRSGGVYIIDPSILGSISRQGYTDLREQLIPELVASGRVVLGYNLPAPLARVSSLEEYYEAQCAALNQGLFFLNGHHAVDDGVWAGAAAAISSSATVIGPVLIGDGTEIASGARVIGPAVIGANCRVGRNSLLRESILWDRATLEEGARVEYSVIGREVRVPAAAGMRETVVMNGHAPLRGSLRKTSWRPPSQVIEQHAAPVERLRRTLRGSVKRLIDVGGAVLGLVLCSPVFALIALAIKGDSPGPVFYLQTRCGKDGRPFRMIKFRTMIQDADRMQSLLEKNKDIDGPMFKVFNDPRVTRLGRILRTTSLDELPQLLNVLAGDMSLVGPRPLVMEEMRFNPAWREMRLTVRPGITGLWQIGGRSHTGFHDWIRCDVAYVKNHSTRLDLAILMKTVLWAFRRTGAY